MTSFCLLKKCGSEIVLLAVELGVPKRGAFVELQYFRAAASTYVLWQPFTHQKSSDYNAQT